MYSQSQTHIGIYLRQTLACCCRKELEGKWKEEETSEREREGEITKQFQFLCSCKIFVYFNSSSSVNTFRESLWDTPAHTGVGWQYHWVPLTPQTAVHWEKNNSALWPMVNTFFSKERKQSSRTVRPRFVLRPRLSAQFKAHLCLLSIAPLAHLLLQSCKAADRFRRKNNIVIYL